MKDKIENYQNNPVWSETIKLYSGLFSSSEERQNFILEIAETNILLAAECKNTSIEPEPELVTKLKNISIQKYSLIDLPNEKIDSILSLVKLGDEKYFEDFILETEVPKNSHKELLIEALIDVSSSCKERLISSFISNKQQTQLAIWLADFLIDDDSFSPDKENLHDLIGKLLNVLHSTIYDFAEKLIKEFSFQNEFDIAVIINQLILIGNKKSLKLAFGRVGKYNLWSKFPKRLFIQKAIETNSFKQAINWINKNKINDDGLIEELIIKIDSSNDKKKNELMNRVKKELINNQN
ncbi:hypothetical protein OAF16_04490, partial [Flavobacteriales bacterium]|nr:hypothetical protein [Flavobacteriales bacterium]